MVEGAGMNVRISAAFAEADLEAVVWPGVSAIYCPRVESAAQVQQTETLVSQLERLRGIRPGTIDLQPLIETPAGVANAYEVASSSARIHAFGPGPKLYLYLDVDAAPEADALGYARSECELVARALDLEPLASDYLGD
jgi:citrate lyase subunit beta / citryl-CoA lyase